MPADYSTAAQNLAVSPSNSRSSSPPPWARHGSSSNVRRLSSARFRNSPRLRQAWTTLDAWNKYTIETYSRMTVLQRIVAGAGIIAVYALIILGWVYSHRLFDWLAGVSQSWRELRGGWLIIFALVFAAAFPPIIGYSTFTTISGFVYGFPWGWPVPALACTVGSLCAFIAARTVLSKTVDRMVGKDARFVALGQVLRRDGIWYLTGIRFCPLPFSMSNGFLATIPSITPTAFALSTALSSPKLLVHVFIGSRLAILAESDDKMSWGDKMVNYLSMAVGAGVGITVGYIIYKRTMARAAEIAHSQAREDEEAEEGRAHGAYLDREDTLMDPEDAANLMTDDDLSLWETQVDEDADYTSDGPKSTSKASSPNEAGRRSPW
ncbi:snare associated Golgi protein-domain-containing protein [Emericellopsis atlantica]|uniref:Golgi apparatus membrane protein TVP38 n=1 Tax=Emericellopsis atlantica TaxID=2614577 RepID=A0A9P7ZRN5_9HYPO|nr:snare associated Golgi protein-domain-containing protein [Emericellopsis atlantica]KAG9256975.1 snare associated Golgi protein-domain-containing protein [Emericellopsis atlantica]